MSELSIRFTSDEKKEDAPIHVSLLRVDGGTYTEPELFSLPLDDAVLNDLHWYLEKFSTWPMETEYKRAERILSQMGPWGRQLLESVLKGNGASRMWQQFVDEDADSRLLTVDALDPRVLRLPWELLADEGGHCFAQGIGVRRRLQKIQTARVQPFSLPVRILVLVSRPEGAGFIDPRADSQALLDAVEPLGSRVEIEFLYPPTLEALTRRVQDRKAPPVQVVHFDGHGVYDSRLGLGYLLFEDGEHQPDRVDADRLGTLLNRCGIPLMVLSACQSGKQEKANPYASVAARLIRSGVGSVIAMNYSVLVAAAQKFTKSFYTALADGFSIGRAMDEGRKSLLMDENRHKIVRHREGRTVEQTIRLRDWFLPALYQQSLDPVVFNPDIAPERQSTERPVPEALANPNAPGGLPVPHHGFHGRSREMLQLERTFYEKPVIILHGFGGMGKTTLAAEAGRWFFQTSRFPGGAAFVSFEQGGSLNQLCSWIGQAVGKDPDFMSRGGDPVERVGELLKERPALIILDNFESVIGKDPHMPPEELKTVLDAVWNWANPASFRRRPESGPSGPGARILITTRDTNITDTRFSPSRNCAHIRLEGLAQHEALSLAGAILADHGIDRAKTDRDGLVALMDRLGGHPLSLYLVLPQLKNYSLKELTEEFEHLLPGFKTGAAKERNESLTVSLEFSIRRLGEETQNALPDLAVFQGGAMEPELLQIIGMNETRWQNARTELEAAALVTAESIPGVAPPFLRFHPTLLPWLADRLPETRRKELETKYWQRYYALAKYLWRSDTQTPHQARAVAVREMPNLKRALDLCIQAGEVETAVEFADRIERFLNYFGRWRERDAMMKKLEGLAPQGEKLGKAEFLMQSRKGEMLLQAGRAAEAEKIFRELLKKLEAGADYDGAYDHGYTLVTMGRCLAALGRPAQAIEQHRKAIEVFGRLSETDENAKKMLSAVYTDLADNLRNTGQFEEAKKHYEKSVEIDKQRGDLRDVGVNLGQLGTLAMMQGNLKEAAERYAEALNTFRQLGEPQMEAVAWHQLGMVHGEAKNWDEADRCYREAVQIRERIQDLPLLATTFNQLALVSKGAGRLEDAERWYLKTIEHAEYLPDQGARVYNNLANLYLTQGRLEEAEAYAHRARKIHEKLEHSSETWKPFEVLAQIAEKKGNLQEAGAWRKKAHESRDEFAGTKYQVARILQQFKPVIEAVAAGCAGNAGAKEMVEGLFDSFKKSGEDGKKMIDSIQKIWNGERDENALTSNLHYNLRPIILAVLSLLNGQNPFEGMETEGSQPSGPDEGEPREQEGEQQGTSLGDLIQMAALASGPGMPPQIREQLMQMANQMSGESDPGINALGRALQSLLLGNKNPDLSALPEEIASAFREALG